jgi:hypothetical protein
MQPMQRNKHCDIYEGAAEELVAAGLVISNELPGRPGRGKTMASYHADGSPVRPGDSRHGWDEPGRRSIKRKTRSRFIVKVVVSFGEQILRGADSARDAISSHRFGQLAAARADKSLQAFLANVLR